MRSTLENASKFLRLLTRQRSAYPEEVQVEVTNACNLTCSMCPHTLGLVPHRDFPFELYERLLLGNPAPRRLVLTGWGEPLMHPRFLDMISLANQQWPETSVRFTTNGILLDAAMREKLKERNVAAVTVSVDLWHESKAWTPEWKDILHPPSPKSFRHIHEYLQDHELMAKAPLVLQLVLVQPNADDVRHFIELMGEKGGRYVNLVRMQTYPGMSLTRMAWEEEQRLLAELAQYGKEHGVEVRTLNRQNLWIRFATRFDETCVRTDDSLYITIEGTCTPCCNLREYSIGSLLESDRTLAQIWNSLEEEKFFHNQRPVCGSCDALFHTYRD